ncbi:UNVERIFIED_ORG: Ca2+-binding RTX toxin-like protein [Rhizobium esperanzae]
MNEGTDTVQTALAGYTLGNNVENLTYTGSASFTGTGNALANTITGGAFNDTLNGGAGADTLIGGAGNDIYIVDHIGDIVTEAADAGTDTVRTTLASYTLGSEVEHLTYIGTTAFAGTGNDLDNTITGGAAADTLSGGAGNDTLNGGAGADRLIGGAGDDIYIVDHAGDIVTEAASAGTDTVRTTLASYTLGSDVEHLTYIGTAAFVGIGNSLDNTITGGTAADTLSGGAGNDTLNGGAGADRLIGGVGDDIYIVDNAGDIVTEAADAGTDTVHTALAAYSIAALTNIENLTYTGSASFTGTGNALANTITGSAGNDMLNGGVGADSLIGGAGNDTYIVDNAGDIVTEAADAGTDTVRTNLASYTLTGNVENLSFVGTGAFAGTGNNLDNTITGGAAIDTLSGGAGNDMLNGGVGADTLIGGEGDDTYIVDHAGDIVTEAADEGTDTVRTALANYTLGSDVENLTYTGAVAFAGTGNSLDNTITGGAGADTLDGNAGADMLIGAAGNDTYIVDNVGDVVTEGLNAGTDLIKTVLSSYTLGNNVENLLYTGSASFTGTGNALVNTITGGAGNDLLDGGAGADMLIGGAGNDIYVVDNAFDGIVEAANAGIDEIRTSLATSSIAALVNVENLTYTGSASFTGTGNALANTITGGAGNDMLNGGAGADSLIGGAGNDTYIVDNAGDIVTEAADAGTDTVRTALAIYTLGSDVEHLTYIGTTAFAGTGNDLDNTITGGAAADTLSGGAGNDTLNGGAGADRLIGGAGDDIYIVDHAGDIVTEAASAGTDTVRTTLASYTLGSDVEHLTYIGTAAFVGIGNSLDNTITGGTAADTLSGGAGNDTLNGGAGADRLIGGVGDDIYIVDNAGDIVTEAADAGTDTVHTALAAYSIAALTNIENLTYTGSASFTGTGNALANTITGSAGNDMLNGGVGADSLIGGAGNDTYIVDNAGDIVTEAADAGTDTVRTNLAAYTLGTNVENLTFIGTGAFAGTGNALNNVIVGGSGSNTLTGGAGNDILTGGAAADVFAYSANWGHDTITNFVATGSAHDTISIDHGIFADWESLFAATEQSGNDTIITADSDNIITLRNVALSSLQSWDFLFA